MKKYDHHYLFALKVIYNLITTLKQKRTANIFERNIASTLACTYSFIIKHGRNLDMQTSDLTQTFQTSPVFIWIYTFI